MAITKTSPVGRSWLVVVGVVALLELFFLYEGLEADLAGSQRVFGVFVGLAIVCFAALLYSVKAVFYDADPEEVY